MSSTEEAAHERLVRAADRVEIIEMLSRYHYAIDGRDWEALESIFTPDATAGYVRVAGGERSSSSVGPGVTAITEWLRSSLRPVETQHYMTNHVFIALDDESATTNSYLSVRGTTTGGVYTGTHVRTDDGWRIQDLTLEQHFDA